MVSWAQEVIQVLNNNINSFTWVQKSMENLNEYLGYSFPPSMLTCPNIMDVLDLYRVEVSVPTPTKNLQRSLNMQKNNNK